MILIDSDEAAKKMTVEGWVSRNGRFYGDNEEIARYDGATHRYCKNCGEIVEISWVFCEKCREKNATETFLNYPEDWKEKEKFIKNIIEMVENGDIEKPQWMYDAENEANSNEFLIMAKSPQYEVVAKKIDDFLNSVIIDAEYDG